MSSTVSFTVRRPTPSSDSDGSFRVPALPRHLASAPSSTTGSPLAASPRSRDDSDDDAQFGIVFASGAHVDDDDGHHTDASDEDHIFANAKHPRGHQRCAFCTHPPHVPIEVDSQQLSSRVYQNKSPREAPLVIPSKPNPDWREAARKRRAACARVQPYTSRATPAFVPDSARAMTGADGSVGGLGTRDTINSGPQLSGLQLKQKIDVDVDISEPEADATAAPMAVEEVVDETDDQRALRAILAGEDGAAPAVDIIPVPPLSEADALKQDVEDLPDVASAEDYARVPISDFGAAMLRGMGWTDGAAAAKSGKRRNNGLTGLYLPQARPALLGIGAKERAPDDDGSEKKKQKRPEMRYVPVARRDSGRGEGGSSRSGTVSRRSSRSPSRRERDDRERRKERDRDDDSRQRKDSDDRRRDRDSERDRSRGDYSRDREGGRGYERRDRTRERDKR